jgi:ATP-binding cassette subfamily B multidrug efflux pump
MASGHRPDQPRYGGAQSTGGSFGFGRGPGRPGGRHLAGFMGPREKPKDSWATLRRLWGYLGRHGMQLVLAFLLILGSSLIGLVGPLLIGQAVDAISPGRGAVDFGRLRIAAGLMLALYMASSLASWFQNYVMVGVSQRTVRDLRCDLFAKLQKLPVRFFDTRTHGELMSRLANDVENVSNTLSQGTTHVFQSIITVSGSLIAMLLLNPLLTLLSLISIPVGIALTGQIAKRTREHFLRQQQELGELNGYIEEMITGQRVVKAFCREEEVLTHFGDINSRLKQSGIKAQVFSGIVPPLMNVMNNLTYALVAGAGGWLAAKGVITLGVIATFLNYSRQFARPINDIANQFNLLQSALAGAERVFEILDEAEEAADIPDAVLLSDVKGDVAFSEVSFEYTEGVPVLSGIGLRAKPGQTIALVGPTGAGKTTVVNLLMRFYDVCEGSISIDGQDIREIQKDSLRRSLGVVLQDTYLFSGTVRENIRYGRLDASDEEVEEAARLANADVFIQRLPLRYDTVLTADGSNLSQGQRQLLTIARAILADPAILVLDEATSSVDTRTEMNIQAAMLSLMEGRTSFVIAHRLSTIQGADEILVIDGGRIIERGTHDELMRRRGFYYELYSSQFRRHPALSEASS